jgi:hypothetical protein
VTLKRTQSLLGSNNKWRFFNGYKSRRHRGKLPEGYDMKFISRDSSNRLDSLRSLNRLRRPCGYAAQPIPPE